MTELINIEELRRMYVEERLALWKICRHFKLSRAQLYKVLRDLKIKRERYVSAVPGHTTCPTCGKSTMRQTTNRGYKDA